VFPDPDEEVVVPVVLRPATTDDAEVIADIYNQAVVSSTASWDLEVQPVAERQAWLEDHADAKHPVLVAVMDDRVVAWGSLTRWSERGAYADTVEVSSYVEESHRGHGIGTSLMNELERLGEAAGVHAFIAQVSADNQASAALMGKLGYEQVGRIREAGVKFGRVLDVLIFEKLAEAPWPR
jgi:L-amino acid N-acyltransferase